MQSRGENCLVWELFLSLIVYFQFSLVNYSQNKLHCSPAFCLDKEMFITACKESHSNNKAGLTEDFIEAVKVEENCQGLEEFFDLYRGSVLWWFLQLTETPT